MRNGAVSTRFDGNFGISPNSAGSMRSVKTRDKRCVDAKQDMLCGDTRHVLCGGRAGGHKGYSKIHGDFVHGRKGYSKTLGDFVHSHLKEVRSRYAVYRTTFGHSRIRKVAPNSADSCTFCV